MVEISKNVSKYKKGHISDASPKLFILSKY